MSIFESKEPMPPKDNSNDPLVVRVAQTMEDVRKNYLPASQLQDRHVQNLDRPRRGHGY